MANEMQKTGGDVARSEAEETRDTGPTFRPATDIFEKDDVVTLTIDMPGVVPDSVDVSVENRSLTVRGTIEAPVPGAQARRTDWHMPLAHRCVSRHPCQRTCWSAQLRWHRGMCV